MMQVIMRLREELSQNAEEAFERVTKKFFREEIQCYGVRGATVKRIAGAFWKEIRTLDKRAIFQLCQELLESDFMEEASVVSIWLPKLSDQFLPEDLTLFRSWIDRYVNNWAKCDGFCNHTVGDFLFKYPESIQEIKTWTRSKNRWMRRAAAVSLILPARKGLFLEDLFEIADSLLEDPDDMVQKGYGWMLKEASRQNQQEIFGYVCRNKKRMPRTALRYAIELMPKELKSEAMKRG